MTPRRQPGLRRRHVLQRQRLASAAASPRSTPSPATLQPWVVQQRRVRRRPRRCRSPTSDGRRRRRLRQRLHVRPQLRQPRGHLQGRHRHRPARVDRGLPRRHLPAVPDQRLRLLRRPQPLLRQHRRQPAVRRLVTQWGEYMRHALSFKDAVAGTIRRDHWGYHNLEGYPAPSQTSWAPEWQTGTYTGLNQATWAVTGNSQYVVYGGEFTRGQQLKPTGPRPLRRALDRTEQRRASLQRRRLPAQRACRRRPGKSGSRSRPTSTVTTTTLTYELLRNNVAVQSTGRRLDLLGPADRQLLRDRPDPGQELTYRVRVTDSTGNIAQTTIYPVTVAADRRADAVRRPGDRRRRPHLLAPRRRPRFDHRHGLGRRSDTERSTPSPSVARERSSATPTPRPRRPAPASRIVQPPLSDPVRRAHRAQRRRSTSSRSRPGSAPPAPRVAVCSASATATPATRVSTKRPRALRDQRRRRDVRCAHPPRGHRRSADSRQNRTIQSKTGLNNGEWHHVVATLSGDGMNSVRRRPARSLPGPTPTAATATTATGGSVPTRSAAGRSQPSSTRLNGDIDEAAVYYHRLTAQQILDALGAQRPRRRPGARRPTSPAPAVAHRASSTPRRRRTSTARSCRTPGTSVTAPARHRRQPDQAPTPPPARTR